MSNWHRDHVNPLCTLWDNDIFHFYYIPIFSFCYLNNKYHWNDLHIVLWICKPSMSSVLFIIPNIYYVFFCFVYIMAFEIQMARGSWIQLIRFHRKRVVPVSRQVLLATTPYVVIYRCSLIWGSWYHVTWFLKR